MIDYSKKGFSDGSPEEIGVWHKAVLNLILVKEKRVIDVGCGSGGFLYTCLKKGAKIVTGIDPNKENCRLVEKSNIEVINDYPENIQSNYHGVYDIATCFEVIEHTYTHKEIVVSMCNLLKNNGVAIISTPNAFNIIRRIKFTIFAEHHDSLMDPTRAEHPEHIRLWSFTMMQRIANTVPEMKLVETIGFVTLFGKIFILKNRFLVSLFSQHLIVFLKKH